MTVFQKILAAIFVIAILSTVSSCSSTLADARSAKGSGTARTYAASTEAVYKAIPPILTKLGLELVGENKTDGYVLAQKGVHGLSYGENVAIFIESRGAQKTRVEVVSKRTVALVLYAPNWEDDILNALDEKLK